MATITDVEQITADASAGGSGLFFNPQDGSNPVRIVKIGQYYRGWVAMPNGWQVKKDSVWTADGTDEGMEFVHKKLAEVRLEPGETLKGSMILAAIVINRSPGEARAQIWEIRQKSIIRQIKTLWGNKAWGDPRNYDIDVVRGDDNGIVTYTITPMPPSELTDGDKALVKDFDINLDDFYIRYHGKLDAYLESLKTGTGGETEPIVEEEQVNNTEESSDGTVTTNEIPF